MFRHISWKLPLILILGIATIRGHSQVSAAASKGNIPLVVGGGISDYSLDWGYGRRMEGITTWVDWDFTRFPGVLGGLGIEAEGSDINFNRPSTLPKMRHDTAQVGATYTLRRYHNFNPYAKLLGGIGSIDFPPTRQYPLYSHDTFSVFSPGGGVEYRIQNRIFVRADYEYQFWLHTFGPRDLNPNGFTIGATYHFQQSTEER